MTGCLPRYNFLTNILSHEITGKRNLTTDKYICIRTYLYTQYIYSFTQEIMNILLLPTSTLFWSFCGVKIVIFLRMPHSPYPRVKLQSATTFTVNITEFKIKGREWFLILNAIRSVFCVSHVMPLYKISEEE